MVKVIDDTNLGYLISKIKSAFWPKTDVVQIGLDESPTQNSDNLVKSGGVYTSLNTKQDKISSTNKLDYSLLNNTPTIPAAQVQSDWNATSGMGVILNKPTIPDVSTKADYNVYNTKVIGSSSAPIGYIYASDDLVYAISRSTNEDSYADVVLATQDQIPTTLDQIVDGNTRKLSNYITKDGGDLNTNAEIRIYEDGMDDNSWMDGHGFYARASGVHTVFYGGDKIFVGTGGSGDFTSQYGYTFPSKSGTFALLSDIPAAVTESTVSGWGFTKNGGTITGITMNGASKGTSGVVDLGTVLTAHQDISGKQDVITDLATIRSNASAGAAKTSANNSTITIQKGGTTVDSFTTNASSGKTINIPNELPTHSSSDAGKILSVNSSGQLVWITPATIYSGSSTPSNSTGNNGDIYLQS